jgi:hypothetical protein
MKAKRYPEIPHVRARVFGEVDPPWEATAEPTAWAATAPPPPNFLVDLIAARVATRHATAPAPAPGQVVLVRVPHPQLPNLLCILLQGQAQTDLWRGWLVTPDLDHAGPGDVPLQDGALALDPMAMLAQAWNPVRVRASWLAGHLGGVSAEVQAACAAAEQTNQAATDDADRREYRGLYQRAAVLIAEGLAMDPAVASTGLARLAEALATWAAATGTLLAPSHWVPEAMHGACAYDACVVAGLVEIQFFDAGSGLAGIRLRLRGQEAATLDMEQDGYRMARKTLRHPGDLAEFVLPTAASALRITTPTGRTYRLPLTPAP